MSFTAAAALLMTFTVQAQQLPEPGRRIEPAKVEKAEPAPPKRPRPRISVKPKGGTGSAIRDDKAGGGPPTAESSKGGTPGTP